MITEAVLDIFFSIIETFLSWLPAVNVSARSGNIEVFMDAVRCVLYLLPLGTINTILGITIAISIFRLVISIIKTIWELIPFV